MYTIGIFFFFFEGTKPHGIKLYVISEEEEEK
jgi:hypothetical protein